MFLLLFWYTDSNIAEIIFLFIRTATAIQVLFNTVYIFVHVLQKNGCNSAIDHRHKHKLNNNNKKRISQLKLSKGNIIINSISSSGIKRRERRIRRKTIAISSDIFQCDSGYEFGQTFPHHKFWFSVTFVKFVFWAFTYNKFQRIITKQKIKWTKECWKICILRANNTILDWIKQVRVKRVKKIYKCFGVCGCDVAVI